MGRRGNAARAAAKVNTAGHHRQPEFVHDPNQNYMIHYQTSRLDVATPQAIERNVSCLIFPQISKIGPPSNANRRKLECGLLGALCATIVLGVLFWVAVQFSVLQLIVQIR